MNRLTDESVLDDENIKFVEDKLEYADKMKDIEEKIGIDLITLFEALIEGIYYIDTNSYFQPDLFYDGEMNLDDENDNFFFKIAYYDDVLETKVIDILSVKNDYKKTWALDKKELEENES